MPPLSFRLLVRTIAIALVLGLGLPVLATSAPATAATTGLPLSGRVTTAGAGVAGVEVAVRDLDREGAVVATATTNADGEYGVAELEPGDYDVVATPAADDPLLLATATAPAYVESGDEVVDLALEVSNVRGTVSRSDGSAAAGAEVEVYARGRHLATTYPDGTYRLALPEGEWELAVLPPVENPTLDVGTSRTVTVVDAVANGDVALARPNLRGTMLAPDGTTAVAGARIRLYDAADRLVAGGTTTSRGDGSFGFAAPTGRYRFEVEPPEVNPDGWIGYRSGLFELTDAHTTAAPLVRDFDLRGPTVTGVVRTPSGDPVPRAWVHVWDSNGVYSRQRADASGHYGLSVPPGPIEVRLNAPVPTQAYLDHDFQVEIDDVPATLDLVFLRPNVTGRAVTATGLPVVNAQVRTFGPADGASARYATTDRQGRFALHLSPGTTQRVVIEPDVSSPDAIRTAASVEVPGEGAIDNVEIVLDTAPASSYDVVPLEVTVGGSALRRMDSPEISHDGTVVAGRTLAESCECLAGDFEGIVLHDRIAGTDEPLLAPSGTVISPDWTVALDDDASTVAFVTGQDGLVEGDEDGSADAFVLDRASDTLTRLVPPADGYFEGANLALSGDGRRLALGVSGVTDDTYWRDVAVVDLDSSGAETSRRLLGLQSSEVTEHALSRDGSTLAWIQFDEGAWNLHVQDLATGAEDPLRPFSEGVDGWNGTGGAPSLSDDGSVVAYADVVHLVEPGSYDQWLTRVRVADRAAGTDRALDPFDFGNDPESASSRVFELSGTGTEVLMTSLGGVPEETYEQAWVVDVADDDAEMVSRAPSGGPAREGVESVSAPSDFSVLALGTRSEDLSGTAGSSVVLALGENVAPQWPDDAALTADAGDIGVTSVRLHWTQATDNVGVTGYRVFRGDALVGATGAGTRQLRVSDLSPDTSYTFTVQAVDGRAAASTDGPSVTVRTLPEESTELRPLDLTARPGGVVDLAWEAAPAADELLLRTYLGDVQVDERALSATATSAQERGLAAGTAYSFQLLTRTGETVRPFTERATVTTGALTLGSVTWTVPTVPSVRTELARRGSTAAITATAEPGRLVNVAVEHRSWYDEEHELLTEPRTVTSVVPLTEAGGAPGTYRGGFELVDGVSRIVGMVATVSDGHGGSLQKASNRAPIAVSSPVVLTIDAPAGSLAGGHVQVSSEATRQSYADVVAGGEVIVLEHLRPATDLAVQVVDGRGRTAAERSALQVRDGLATAVTLRPVLPATLTVVAAKGSLVQLTDADTGDHLGARRMYDATTEFRDVYEGQRVHVDVEYDAQDLLEADVRRTLTMTAGANRVEVLATPAPRAALTGVVRYDDGQPAPGATVVLTQTHHGAPITRTTTAGADGRYELEALRAPGSLVARSGQLRETAEVDLSGGARERDLTLSGPREFTVSLRLFTRPAGAGSETGPIPLDWRTAVHYGMTLVLQGRSLGHPAEPRTEDESATVTVNAMPGQVLNWCIQGNEAKLQRTCVAHTLTAGDRTPTVEMHAGPGVDVAMRLVDGAGTPVTDAQVAVYQVLPTGRMYVAGGLRPRSVLTERVPTAGSYLLEVSKGDLTASRTFSVGVDDDSVDLGEVALGNRTHFTGTENVVLASRSDVLPGGDVEMRASWRNRGTALSDVTARIAVPADTTLVPDSIVVDGRPVPNTAGDGYVDVELGAVAADGTGSLRYRLRAGSAATALPGRVDLRYPVAGSVIGEPLEPATVPVVSVTITGPATTGGTRIPLNGRAPAGRTVTISDGGVPVGTAVAGPGGYWSATVPLVEQARTRTLHQLVAETVVDGERFFAEHDVIADVTLPTITKVSLYQLDGDFPNGRRITFDPIDGVARFPFVFVPYQDLRVEVTFDDPSRVSRADVLIGATRVPGVRRTDGVFVATLRSSRVAGPISVDFDGIPKPVDLRDPEQTEREVRDSIPAPFSGFELSEVEHPVETDTAPRTGSFRMSIPSIAGGSVRSTLTVTRETYTPTAEDVALRQATGAPAYGVTSTRSGSTLSFSMLVPLADLPGVGARIAAEDDSDFGQALAKILRDAVGPEAVPTAAAGGSVGVARVGFQLAFNGTTTLDSLLSALGAGDKYEKLANALKLTSQCSVEKIKAYDDRAQNILAAAVAADVGGALFNVGSVVFGPATFGLGTVALGVLGVVLDKVIGAQIDKAINALALDIETDPDCRDKEKWVRPDPPRPPVADPVWIYDPSGYVYEGARSVRIPGVTATLLTAPSEDGPWTAWDAEWFGQTNPQTTDDDGRYGWDVPEGWWKVAFTKDGYRPAYSRVLRVLPPHLDVDVSMVKDGLPHVTGSVLRDGRVEVSFDRLVRSATADRSLTVVDADGAEVPGTWTALGSTTGDGDAALQRGLRFTPAATLPGGSRVTVTVDAVADYSGRMMGEPYATTLTVPVTGGGGGPGGPGDPDDQEDPEKEVPDAPAEVTAEAGERRASVSWSEPDDNGAEILDYLVTVQPSGQQLTVDGTETEVDGLTPGTAYTFTVTARNEVGTGPASAPSDAVVPSAIAPETVLMTAPTGYVASRVARMAWAATGASYVCELDGVTRACDGTGANLSALRSGTHTFTVAARDADGDLDPTPATTTWTVPRDDRALAGNKAWKRRHSDSSFQGTLTETSARGATLTARVEDATALALVVSRGFGHGKVAVYLGRDRVGTVNLATTVWRRPVVPLRAFDSPRSGTVRIVVVSRHAVVRVDGLAVATG
ncbi:carboxypeptidase regulatory-like domain-containing protein [Nocardioides sp. SR21]|uniref:carboxypeptidase regulatory-like domain-containing protein n=1 Tax=Nocardioides sp. SR21 TaxID=2919501 RepID=UPI001FA94CE1|nr:carboxypeptidase regulatory-like domain-containing protein [Nocardioides sp. SR21]